MDTWRGVSQKALDPRQKAYLPGNQRAPRRIAGMTSCGHLLEMAGQDRTHDQSSTVQPAFDGRRAQSQDFGNFRIGKTFDLRQYIHVAVSLGQFTYRTFDELVSFLVQHFLVGWHGPLLYGRCVLAVRKET